MLILPAHKADFDRLTEIWEAAVRATHSFLTEPDIQGLRSEVRDVYLRQVAELFKTQTEDGAEIIAFMGLTPPKGESWAKLDLWSSDCVLF